MSLQDIAFIATSLIGLWLLLFELWRLRGRGTSTARAMRICIGFTVCAFICDIPLFSQWSGEATGVSNIARLGSYVFALAGVGSAQVLALAWRYPPEEVRQRLRRVIHVHGTVIVAVMVLFALSDVPRERPRDFPVHYGGQPTVVALATLYFSTLTVSMVRVSAWLLSWARSKEFAGLTWLRIGLLLYGSETVLLAVWGVTGLACVTPLWFGAASSARLYDLASAILLPLVGILVFGALTVPVVGPRIARSLVWLNRWRAFLLLRPLHRRLLADSDGHVLVAPGKRLDPHHRVRRMVIELNDRWAALSRFYDPGIRDATEREARARGLSDDTVEALVEAAQLRAAIQDRAHDGGSPRPTAHPPRDPEAVDGRGGVDSELQWCIRVARAERHPLLAARTAHRRFG